jgi:hypothetical protein
VTGSALVVGWDGKAQFVRYRRELAFDDPRGEPGDFKLTVGKPQRVRIVVKEFPERIGYRCIAYDGDREITRADFPPEWGKDRRYHPTDINRRLVADFPQPPQAGFLAVISNPPLVIRLNEIRVVGRVADAWRADRTRVRKVVDDLMQPAEKQEGTSKPEESKPDESEKPEAKAEEPADQPKAEAPAEPAAKPQP